LRVLCYSVYMKNITPLMKEIAEEIASEMAERYKGLESVIPTPEDEHEWEQAQVEQVERFRDF